MSTPLDNAKYEYSTNQLIENKNKATVWNRTKVATLNRMKWLNLIGTVEYGKEVTAQQIINRLTETQVETMRTFFMENIAHPDNWKLPICPIQVKTLESATKLKALISFFVGGAEVEEYCSNVYIVTSKGYYHYIGA